MPYPDSDWQRFTPWGGPASTVASAATVVVGPGLTVLTGNVAIANIMPPVNGPHIIGLMFAGVAGVVATGNIATAKATVVGEVLLLVFNTITNKYVPVG
jgi:hypothetical protein